MPAQLDASSNVSEIEQRVRCNPTYLHQSNSPACALRWGNSGSTAQHRERGKEKSHSSDTPSVLPSKKLY